MSSCTNQECVNKFTEYKYGIDKLLMRLRESEREKSEHIISNITLKQQLNQPNQIENKHFTKLLNDIEHLSNNFIGNNKHFGLFRIHLK